MGLDRPTLDSAGDGSTEDGSARPLPRPPWSRHPTLLARLMSDPRPVLVEIVEPTADDLAH